MSEPCGHIDFYPNNGKEQPGCDLTETPLPLTLIKEGIEEASRVLVACNHVRAIKLFIESINSKCPYVAHKCNTFQNFLQVIIKQRRLCCPVSRYSPKYPLYSSNVLLGGFFFLLDTPTVRVKPPNVGARNCKNVCVCQVKVMGRFAEFSITV